LKCKEQEIYCLWFIVMVPGGCTEPETINH
jgi:hypothetical protein